MIKIFFLLVNIATGSSMMTVSEESYETVEACKAAVTQRVANANAILNPRHVFIKATVCTTEDEMDRKATEQSS